MKAFYTVDGMTVEMTERQKQNLFAYLPTDIANSGDDYKFTLSSEFLSDFAVHCARMGQVLADDATETEIKGWQEMMEAEMMEIGWEPTVTHIFDQESQMYVVVGENRKVKL